MKIQELAIIFIIIILPISLILSAYTQLQIQTLNMQTLYDTKLTAAAFDAIKAFQLNTANSTTSELGNSKIRDIEASVNTFKNSIKTAFGLSGISEEEIDEYVPALVYTMYDGFYVYAPYTNTNYLYEYETNNEGIIYDETTGEPIYKKDENGDRIPLNNNDQNIFGLQPYVTYTCSYKYDYNGYNNDITITYSLDNFISIKGMINGEYVADEGYLIDGIRVDDTGQVSYNGIQINAESALIEYVGGISYPYVKINGTKYYYDAGDGEIEPEIFYISNGERTTQGQTKGDAAIKYYNDFIANNSSAFRYYRDAYDFGERVKGYGLENITYGNAYDVTISNDASTAIDESSIWGANEALKDINVFDFNPNSSPTAEPDQNIECELSNFTQHKLAVIRYVIEKNLKVVISNYNNYSQNTVDFQMPELTDEEWDNVIKNISLICYVQGVPIGGKIYNGYTIVNNTESKEVVKEEDIYIMTEKTDGLNEGIYHKIGDAYLEDDGGNIKSDSAGRLKLDFKRKMLLDDNKTYEYYYPRREYASYDSVVMQNQEKVSTYDDIYAYIAKQNDNLKKAFYTALGRERAGQYKNENYTEKTYNVLVVGTCGSSDATNIENYERYTKDIATEINSLENIKAEWVYSTYTNQLAQYIRNQQNNYNLILVNAYAWQISGNLSTALNEASTNTNIITISNDAKELSIMEKDETKPLNGTNIESEITEEGKKIFGNLSLGVDTDSTNSAIKFNDMVEVFYHGQYKEKDTGEPIGKYDLIGSWQIGEFKWIHSQFALRNSTNHLKFFRLLVNYALK